MLRLQHLTITTAERDARPRVSPSPFQAQFEVVQRESKATAAS